MAYTAVAMPTSPAAASAAMDIAKEHNGLRRSHSSKELCTRSLIRRSYSDNHLCCSMNPIRATSVPPKLQSNRSMGIFPGSMLPNSLCSFLFDPRGEAEGTSRVYKSEVAAYMAASTMTAVVAAGEKEKQEAAKDLQSVHSSPCEWFVCDNPSNYTRCFVIQGSDSLASWQANLFFEPTKFEDTDVLVHRGIYEAAKGIYKQFMPEIMDHLKRHGDRAKLQFTGHSLGGSLSLLVHLMLLTNKVVSPSTLRPVVTFGSPFVFCGGQKLLEELGLDERNIHCVIMHRDIVPRAFTCNYPNHVAVVLKRLNSSFRSHPCLHWVKYSSSNLMRRHLLHTLYSLKEVPSMPWMVLGVDTFQVSLKLSLKLSMEC